MEEDAKIRDYAGWSRDASTVGPTITALLAAAAEPMPPGALVALESKGVTLIYGRDEVAINAARRLADYLDVTVLLSNPGEIAAQHNDFPVLQGTIVSAKGHLGAFELRIDDYAAPSPGSRTRLVFGPTRDGATSHCDVVVDLSGGTPLFTAHDLRSGYLRADPRDAIAVERALFDASHLVGEFDKPRFVDFHPELCAHSRSRITGCTRCLDVCPTGAIAPAGNHVAMDPYICAGCGSCASVCPTGAEEYALPPADALMRKLRTLMLTYASVGGREGVVLFHDGDHGEPLIEALARFGGGLPANVLPVRVNEVTQVGLEAIAALFAYGAVGVRFLTRGRPKHDITALERTVLLAETIVQALGYGAPSGGPIVGLIQTDDPDALGAAFAAGALGTPASTPASFMPRGEKRGVLEFALRELHLAAPRPVDVVPLPAAAPFGGLEINIEGCTLCLACVSTCPTHALSDNAERPMLRFSESLCVQCGLCAATCPEHVIALKPQLDFAAWKAPPRVVKEEEPFHCLECGKAFGTRSSIERVIERLQNRHWMFAGSAGQNRVRVLMMCEDCRVEAVANESFDPHAAPERPKVRMSEDYLTECAQEKDETTPSSKERDPIANP
ncbi:MAG TPA: 4Fe-4S dicluster domain-containing protein [Beijerinckiaceae bacterium]|nr:4Fe-4S dicluster domain-containing protein [Beijerinckiaceae bacterium]